MFLCIIHSAPSKYKQRYTMCYENNHNFYVTCFGPAEPSSGRTCKLDECLTCQVTEVVPKRAAPISQ